MNDPAPASIEVGATRIIDAAPATLTTEDELRDQLHVLTDGLVRSPDKAWIVARYTHGDGPPNRNGHLFRTSDLEVAHAAVPHTPLNMMHQRRHVVGTFARSTMWYPDGYQKTSDRAAPEYTATPIVRTVAALWAYHFPQEVKKIRDAHEAGTLFVSQESVPVSVNCPTCDHRAPWKGYINDGNCEHMNQPRAPRWMEQPRFLGGGVVIPPWQPGWKDAYVETFDALAAANPELAEAVFTQVQEMAAHATQVDIETIAAQIMARAGVVPADTSRLVAPLWAKAMGHYAGIDIEPPTAVRGAILAAAPEVAGLAAPVGYYAADVTTGHVEQALRLYRGNVPPSGIRKVAMLLEGGPGDGSSVDLFALFGGEATQAWVDDVVAKLDARDAAISAMLANAFEGADTDAALAAARDEQALPDGTFRIVTPEDLKVGVAALAQVGDDLRATAKAHLLRRAKELNAPAELIAMIEALPT